MFGPFKGMNFRSQISLYLHSQTGVGRSDLAKITEVNRVMLERQRLGEFSIEESAENLCLRILCQHFISYEAEEVLSLAYGSAFRSAITLSHFGLELCMRHRRSDLEYIFAYCWSPEIRWMRSLAHDLLEAGVINRNFFDTLEESDSWVMGGKLEFIVNSMPDWLNPTKLN